jgi:hypothetical protein
MKDILGTIFVIIAIVFVIAVGTYNISHEQEQKDKIIELQKQLKEKSKFESVTLIRAFKNTGNWDSVYLYSDGHLNIIQSVHKEIEIR